MSFDPYFHFQVACLSVFASLCLHCTADPAVVSASSEVFGFMVARAKADLSSLAPDNNVRYMALQALAGLTGVQLQIFLRQAPEVRVTARVSFIGKLFFTFRLKN